MNSLNWSDSLEIAIALSEKYADIDPLQVRFVDLRDWVLALEGFEGEPERCSERALEAIQMCWLEEK